MWSLYYPSILFVLLSCWHIEKIIGCNKFAIFPWGMPLPGNHEVNLPKDRDLITWGSTKTFARSHSKHSKLIIIQLIHTYIFIDLAYFEPNKKASVPYYRREQWTVTFNSRGAASRTAMRGQQLLKSSSKDYPLTTTYSLRPITKYFFVTLYRLNKHLSIIIILYGDK